MPLGPEPRRGANTAAANETLQRLDFKRPFSTYHLTNTAEHIALLERGKLPTENRTRSPEGIFFVSFHFVVAMLQARS